MDAKEYKVLDKPTIDLSPEAMERYLDLKKKSF